MDREYVTAFTIPEYLVQEIGDDGMVHVVSDYPNDKHGPNTDDLRIAIILSGGHRVLLDCGARMVMKPDGIDIQFLRPVRD